MTQEREAFSDLPPLPEPRTLSRGDEDGTIQLGYTADQMHAYARASVAQPASVPHPGSPEASAMIDSELAAHGWPSNTKNAARAGYKACSKLLAAAPQAPQPAQAVPVAWIRWEWNRTGSKSLVFDRPAKLSLSEEARGVVYDPLYAAPSAQAEPQKPSLMCPKCGVDRLKAACPKGHSAALTGDCPMVAKAQAEQGGK